MSSSWVIRFSIYTICFVAIVAFTALEPASAQQGGAGAPPIGEDDDPSSQQDGPRKRRARGNERPGGAGDRARGENSRANQQQTKASRPKFINLLEEGDLSQFRGYAAEEIGEGWSLDGKALYFDGSGGGDVITKEIYDNFDLQVEWKVADGANSGIMYRVGLGDSAPYMSGPEYQVLDNTEHEDGKNPITSAGSLYGMFPVGDSTLKKVGSWNKTRIIVDGNKITHMLNLKKVLSVKIGSDEWNEALGKSKFKDWEKFAKNSEGHIAFQDHGNEVWYRNIRIKRLPSSQLADQHASAATDDDRPKRKTGSKFSQMQSAAPGSEDKSSKRGSKFEKMQSAAPGSEKKDGANRGSKFEKMQSAAPGSDKKDKKKGSSKFEKMQSAAPGSKKGASGPGSPDK